MEINLERIPIGIKYLKENEILEDFDAINNPKVRSFCDAARLLHDDDYPNGLLVTLESIKACKWCPVALGLKNPETGLEKNIEPLFDELNHGVHIINMSDSFSEPDVVSLVSNHENVEKMIKVLGLENFTREYLDQLTFSLVSEFSGEELPSKRAKRKRKRHLRSIRMFQRLFASKLISNRLMTGVLTFMLKRYAFSRVMDPILRKYSTGMSLCYAAAAIPLTTQKANVVFTDTGAIGWGGMSKDSLQIGLPYSQYKQLESNIVISNK